MFTPPQSQASTLRDHDRSELNAFLNSDLANLEMPLSTETSEPYGTLDPRIALLAGHKPFASAPEPEPETIPTPNTDPAEFSKITVDVPPRFAKHTNHANSKPQPQPQTPAPRKPAPEGCMYVSPEDIPRLKSEERKRRIEFERKLVAEMRELYAEQETDRLLEEDADEEEAEREGQRLASEATYSQLKQAVGSLVRMNRELKPEELSAEKSETKQLIDVEKFTMSELCKDIPVGDRNESFDDYELARINRRRETVRVFRAKMWSRKKYIPRAEERAELQEAYRKYQGERQSRSGKIKAEQDARFSELDEASEESLPQASIEIQADGSISLVGTQFDRHKNNMSHQELGSKSKTEVDPTEQIINSHSFATKERPDRWSVEETAKFYEALSAWGTDFNLISHLFPFRSRNQIKTKYKYEEKRNPVKVQMHLLSRRKVNLASYAKVSEVKIEDVDIIETEIENVRKEHADQMRLGEASKAEAKAEDLKRAEHA